MQRQTSFVDYNFDVDAVYTWVKTPKEGSEVYKEIEKSCGKVVPQRYRDHQTLVASVISLQAFLPWIRKVFIVTSGEEPCWKEDMDIPIELVTHEQIFPEELQNTDLPSHNSIAIETHLHRIPGLAERFIYLNDDMFIGNPLQKSFFFTPDGKPIYDDSPQEVGQEAEGPDLGPISSRCKTPGISTHQANPFRKSAIKEQQKSNPHHFEQLSGQRCRANNTAEQADPPFWTYTCYHIDHGYAVRKHVHSRNALLSSSRAAWYTSVLAGKPDRFCINYRFDTTPAKDLKSEEKALADFIRIFSARVLDVDNSLKPPSTLCHVSFEQIMRLNMLTHQSSAWQELITAKNPGYSPDIPDIPEIADIKEDHATPVS